MNTENKLPEDFKQKWVAALRSGEYKQGKYVLYCRAIDSFCCIGVAGKIKGVSLEEMEGKSNPGSDKVYKSCINLGDSFVRTLTLMNDYQGKSFSDIADWIEQNL